jgi:hypothetical protein
MNIALEQTEEYVNGQLKNKYGDAFIRGNNGKIFTVILSFLKREREHFPLFVLRRYCVTALTFLGVPDHSALQTFTVSHELSIKVHERSLNAPELSMSVFDRL